MDIYSGLNLDFPIISQGMPRKGLESTLGTSGGTISGLGRSILFVGLWTIFGLFLDGLRKKGIDFLLLYDKIL